MIWARSTSYVAERGGTERAGALLAGIRADLERLALFPSLGRAAGTADKDTRQLVLPRLPYRVIYRVRGRRVTVLRIVHTARRWPDARG